MEGEDLGCWQQQFCFQGFHGKRPDHGLNMCCFLHSSGAVELALELTAQSAVSCGG